MFDAGFLEVIVIAAVALLVVGPDRMPELARSAGRWAGKLKRFVSDVKTDLERELKADELRQMMTDETVGVDLSELGSEVKEVVEEVKETLNDGLFSLKNQELQPQNRPDSSPLDED